MTDQEKGARKGTLGGPYAPAAYATIADHYRQLIKSGDLPGGSKLPSERELCNEWGVSAITARAAVRALRDEGLVYGVRGKGSFVRKTIPLIRDAPRRYWRPHNEATYRHEASKAGRTVEVEHETTQTRASADVAERLGISEGDEVMETSYLITMDQQPISMSLCWEPYALVGGTEIEDPHEGPHAGRGIVPRFDSMGHHVDEVEEVLNVRMPGPAETMQLDIPPGVPVVTIRQTFRAGEVPVETADITFPGDRYELHYRMEIK
jgi:GntR family transcriptional regulator